MKIEHYTIQNVTQLLDNTSIAYQKINIKWKLCQYAT